MRGHILVAGKGEGPVLATMEPLSFWGGLNPATGEVIDRHHPLSGRNVAGRILVMPSGRGSSSSSGILLEAIVAGRAPAAILLSRVDDVFALGAIVADEVFALSVPVLVLDGETYTRVAAAAYARVGIDGSVQLTVSQGS